MTALSQDRLLEIRDAANVAAGDADDDEARNYAWGVADAIGYIWAQANFEGPEPDLDAVGAVLGQFAEILRTAEL